MVEGLEVVVEGINSRRNRQSINDKENRIWLIEWCPFGRDGGIMETV